MKSTIDCQKQLARFINFHNHAHAPTYNTIEGIIGSGDLKENIEMVMKFLNRDYVVLDYSVDINSVDFLKKLLEYLVKGKTVFIHTNTLKLNPIVYDQLINFRRSNNFNIDRSKSIGPEAKLFLIAEKLEDQNGNAIYELTDHVLDLRKEGN
jgi:hypothetical protein